MRTPLRIKKCDGQTDIPTDMARCSVACPRLKNKRRVNKRTRKRRGRNKAENTTTPVACGWAGAIIEVTPSFGQEQ